MTTIALPGKFAFTVWIGATFRKTVTLLQGDTGSPPRNLTGYTSALSIFDKAGGTLLYALTTSNGGITLGGALGTIALYIPASETATFSTWPNDAGVYDLSITDAAGSQDVEVLLWGRISAIGLTAP